MERFRHDIEEVSGLSSGFVQACRDRASALVKAWLVKRNKWQRKTDLLENDIKKLEDRKTRLEPQGIISAFEFLDKVTPLHPFMINIALRGRKKLDHPNL